LKISTCTWILDYYQITIQLALDNSNYHQRTSEFCKHIDAQKVDESGRLTTWLGDSAIAPAAPAAVKLQTAESHAAVRHVFTTFIEGLVLEQI
jgi:hypothetical protein